MSGAISCFSTFSRSRRTMLWMLYTSDTVHASENPAMDIGVSCRRTTRLSDMITVLRSLNGVVIATTTALATLTKTNVTRLTTMAKPPLRSKTTHTTRGNRPSSMLIATAEDSSVAAPMAQTRHCSGEESNMSPGADSWRGCTRYCTNTRRTTSSINAVTVSARPKGDRDTSPALIMHPPMLTSAAAKRVDIRKGSMPRTMLRRVTPTGRVEAIIA
mmetsp:Transcript_2747/g.4388  ORF Transcript_2747/g.4388 Transcript_2747/m.4388 type:complete len:216 (-) Transcript_2747:348-995(-)